MASQVKRPVMLDETGQRIAAGVAGIAKALQRGSHTLYAFHINGNESDPSSMITYLEDATGLTAAKMNYTTGTFDWGSWKDAFFMPRPCMVRQAGGVDYYLDEDDYTKKEDGTESDVANADYEGNAMMEWGRDGKKIWYKIAPDSGDTASATIYIADEQLDDSYHAWSFINNQGHYADHFYTSIYNGSNINSVMRSLSGQTIGGSLAGATEITYALANNKDTNVCWYTEVFSDRQLITFLGYLMFKTTDLPGALGRGLDSGSQTALNAYKTGALNAMGLFYGYNDGSHGVKFFGMENWWAAQWRRTAGLILSEGDMKVKLTYGTQDGSTTEGYNSDGSGYKSQGVTPSGSSGGYVSKMHFSEDAMVSNVMSGSSSTYYCDGTWYNNSGARYALFGGASNNGLHCGPVCCGLNDGLSVAGWRSGAALSYKPLG